MPCFIIRFEIVGRRFHPGAQFSIPLDGVDQLAQPAGAFASRAVRAASFDAAHAQAEAQVRGEVETIRLWSDYEILKDGVTELPFMHFVFENPPHGFAFYMN